MEIRGSNVYVITLDLSFMQRMLHLQATMPLQDLWQMRLTPANMKGDENACVPHRIEVLNKAGERLHAAL